MHIPADAYPSSEPPEDAEHAAPHIDPEAEAALNDAIRVEHPAPAARPVADTETAEALAELNARAPHREPPQMQPTDLGHVSLAAELNGFEEPANAPPPVPAKPVVIEQNNGDGEPPAEDTSDEEPEPSKSPGKEEPEAREPADQGPTEATPSTETGGAGASKPPEPPDSASGEEPGNEDEPSEEDWGKFIDGLEQVRAAMEREAEATEPEAPEDDSPVRKVEGTRFYSPSHFDLGYEITSKPGGAENVIHRFNRLRRNEENDLQGSEIPKTAGDKAMIARINGAMCDVGDAMEVDLSSRVPDSNFHRFITQDKFTELTGVQGTQTTRAASNLIVPSSDSNELALSVATGISKEVAIKYVGLANEFGTTPDTLDNTDETLYFYIRHGLQYAGAVEQLTTDLMAVEAAQKAGYNVPIGSSRRLDIIGAAMLDDAAGRLGMHPKKLYRELVRDKCLGGGESVPALEFGIGTEEIQNFAEQEPYITAEKAHRLVDRLGLTNPNALHLQLDAYDQGHTPSIIYPWQR